MSSGGKAAAGSVAAAATYVGGRVATNSLTLAQNLLISGAQIAALKWMLDKQDDSWEKVSHKQIRCVEVAINEFLTTLRTDLLPTVSAAYPDVLHAIACVPVDPAVSNFAVMVDNIANTPKTQEYIVAANHWHRVNYMARTELLSPGFTTQLRRTFEITSNDLAGTMPVGDAAEIVSDVAEAAAMTGRIGNVAGLTHFSLGVSKRRLHKEGQAALARHVEMLNAISPVGSELTFEAFMEKPENRINLALQQAQLVQNSLQAIANRNAQKAPHLLAELQTKLQMAVAVLQLNANKANMQNQFVPNYAGVFGNAVNGLLKQLAPVDTGDGGRHDAPDLSGAVTPQTTVSAI